MLLANEILQTVMHRLSDSEKRLLLQSIEMAEEVVIFGSYAYGCETPDSDLDILLVGTGRKRKSRNLDLVWVTPERLFLRTWLRSELASHVSKYGIWLKGDGSWRSKTEITKSAINKKKIKILISLSHLYVKGPNLSSKSKVKLISDIFIDIYRLNFLAQKEAVPPTCVLRQRLSNVTTEELYSLTHSLLGEAGEVLLRQCIQSVEDFDAVEYCWSSRQR